MTERGGAFVCLFLALSVFFFLFILQGCETTSKPRFDLKFWAGDSVTKSIVRSQVPQSIACSDAQFDQFVCISQVDMLKLSDKLSACK